MVAAGHQGLIRVQTPDALVPKSTGHGVGLFGHRLDLSMGFGNLFHETQKALRLMVRDRRPDGGAGKPRIAHDALGIEVFGHPAETEPSMRGQMPVPGREHALVRGEIREMVAPHLLAGEMEHEARLDRSAMNAFRDLVGWQEPVRIAEAQPGRRRDEEPVASAKLDRSTAPVPPPVSSSARPAM